MSYDRASVRAVLDKVKAEGRTSLTPAECTIAVRRVRDPTAQRGDRELPREMRRASRREIGFPVVMKIVSPDILHKTDAGAVVIEVEDGGRG